MEFSVNINCPHFEKCSGCQFNTNVGDIPIYSDAQEFFLKKGLQLPPLRTGSPTGWRTRAKLAIRGTSQEPEIGLFEEGSHRIVDIPQCRVHYPSINDVIEKLKTWIKERNVSVYREAEHDGFLRYVQCSIERKTGRVQVVLVLNGPADAIKKELLEFYEKEKQTLHSLWVNVNTRSDNVIFGDTWQLIAGDPLLWEELCGVSVCFHPACFCQANLAMYEELITGIRKQIPADASVLEMYAGVGAIGLCLVETAARVCCVEITPEAQVCFAKSLERLPAAHREKITLLVLAAISQVDLLTKEKPSVLVVDPPRKGLDRALLTAIDAADSLERIVYVSCGWAGFKRDCEALMSKGWLLNYVEAFLFFPGTNHLELLVVFEKRR